MAAQSNSDVVFLLLTSLPKILDLRKDLTKYMNSPASHPKTFFGGWKFNLEDALLDLLSDLLIIFLLVYTFFDPNKDCVSIKYTPIKLTSWWF